MRIQTKKEKIAVCLMLNDPDREICNLPDPAAVPASPAVRSPGVSSKIKANHGLLFCATFCLVHFFCKIFKTTKTTPIPEGASAMPRKSNEKRSVVAVVSRPPGLNIVFDEDADDDDDDDDDGDEKIDDGDDQRSVVAVVPLG